jgi:thymidylate synthase
MTRIYSSCKEAISEEFRNVSELGIEVQSSTMQDKDVRNNPEYLTKEIVGATFTIVDTSDFEDIHEYMKNKTGIDFNKTWCDAEFLERVSKEDINPGNAYKLREEIWNEYLHNGKFAYTYNERIRPWINTIIKQLEKNKTSRQAIISIFNPSLDVSNMGGKNRIPCSILYQFLIRKVDNKELLHMIYFMRSSDLLTHWPNDLYLAIKMQRYIAKKLGLEPGYFTMFISSFHAYRKELNKYNIF